MKLDKFLFFLTSTVMLGSLLGLITGAFNILMNVSWYSGVIEGGVLGTNCLMGFWAFLMLNFTVSVSLPQRVWKWAQILVLSLVIYDMFYWRYHYAVLVSPANHQSLVSYTWQALVPLVVAILTGMVKQRLSGKGSFLPTLFFVYVFTALDSMLVLRLHASSVINQTGIIMLLCNVYMILIFGLLLKASNHESNSVQAPRAHHGRLES